MEALNRAVFLDRDGVINEEFSQRKIMPKMFPNASAAIKKLNNTGFLVVIATNKPQIAKGWYREADVRKTNKLMVKRLEKAGARIDAVYYCPHHPEQRNDIPAWARKYRVVCSCRKPGIGMFAKAQKRFGIDFHSSYSIGDRTVDTQCGKNVGATTILVKTGYAGKDMKLSARADYECKDIMDAANLIESLECSTAIILAGGRGERLRPLTDALPKPMLPVAGRPVMEHQIELLRKHGIRNIVICGHYLFQKIKDHFGDGRKFGVRISYIDEAVPLGTGGAIKNAERFIKNRFIVLYGDEMLDVNVRKLLKFHSRNKGVATIVLHETTHPEDSDLVSVGRNGRITRLFPKPHGRVRTRLSKSALYVFEPKVFSFLPNSGGFEVSLQSMIKTKRVFGYVTGEYIKDMGTFERYEDVRKRFEKHGKKAQAPHH